jgi:hypothetical protein
MGQESWSQYFNTDITLEDIKSSDLISLVAHTCSPSYREAEVGGSRSEAGLSRKDEILSEK